MPGTTKIDIDHPEAKGFRVGMTVLVGADSENVERRVVKDMQGDVQLDAPLKKDHDAGEILRVCSKYLLPSPGMKASDGGAAIEDDIESDQMAENARSYLIYFVCDKTHGESRQSSTAEVGVAGLSMAKDGACLGIHRGKLETDFPGNQAIVCLPQYICARG